MKKILLILSFMATMFTAFAGDVYAPITVMAAGTNGVSAATTNTYSSSTYTFDVRKQRSIGVLLSFTCGGTNASTIVLTLERSLDNSFYDAVSTIPWSVTANGTNTVTQGTNLALTGFGWIRLKTVANPNATVGLTNITLQYAVKQAD